MRKRARRTPAVPGVEVAHNGNARCVGRPNGEIHTLDPVNRPQLGAELGITIPMHALTQKMKVIVRQ